MSTFLNYSVQTKEEFKNWILTELGEPLITVELHDTQLEQAINNAVEEFSKWVTYEKDFIAVDLTSGYVQGVGATLPDTTVAVWSLQDDLIGGGGVSQLFSIPNAMWNVGMWPKFTGGTVGWIDYHLAMTAVEQCAYMTGKGFKFEYNPRTKILKLYPDPVAEKVAGWIVCGVYVMRPEQQQYGESWVKRYALACAKEMLGRTRTKFQGVQLLGGGTIDTSVLEEGKADKVTLLDELKGEQGPCEFYVG